MTPMYELLKGIDAPMNGENLDFLIVIILD